MPRKSLLPSIRQVYKLLLILMKKSQEPNGSIKKMTFIWILNIIIYSNSSLSAQFLPIYTQCSDTLYVKYIIVDTSKVQYQNDKMKH